MNQFVVYTAITRGYDALRSPPELWRGEAAFVAFLEDQPPQDTEWEVRPLYRRFRDPCRNAKIHKILPHKYFPDAKYSLWLDGSIEVISRLPLRQWAEEFLSEHDLAVFKHPQRNCIYQEAVACINGRADALPIISQQMQRYCREGYPPENGLAECTVLFRRHTKAMQRFDEAWYAEIRRHSRRDQLSFNYVAHKLGFAYKLLPGTLAENEHFVRLRHKGRRFQAEPRSAPAKRRAKAADTISMVYLYYDNPQMLREQIKCWKTYDRVLAKPPSIILVDDGSPNYPAVDVVRKYGGALPIQVFRIQEDILWNFPGARNLGCAQAEGWIYMSDIDMLLYAEDAKRLFEGVSLGKKYFYTPQRMAQATDKRMKLSMSVQLFHKDRFTEIGGYDEDYAGHYGKDDRDFFDRVQRVALRIERKDVFIRSVDTDDINDADTVGLPRDTTHNEKLYLQKQAAGFPKPVNPLRFAWERAW